MSVLPVGIGSEEAGGYQIERSLRFNSADSAYLSRTFGTPTNQNLWTFSVWLKRTGLGTFDTIIGNLNTTYPTYQFLTSDKFGVYDSGSGSTTAVYRDPSAWYHFVIQRTSSTAVSVYVNGVLANSFTSQTNAFNTSGSTYTIGRSQSGEYFDGYMAEVHFIDGQALTPSSFGETDSDTGVWKPKAYTGSYGTNGFYLDFADNSNNTATTLGKDSSGNGNNWTPNQFSISTGAGNDSLVDSPTRYGTDTGVGGEVRGNYATWNPLILAKNYDSNSQTITNGNLVSQFTSNTSAGKFGGSSTIGVSSGKWYVEIEVTGGGTYPTYTNLGITGDPMYNATVTNASIGQQDYSVGWYNASGVVYRNGSVVHTDSQKSSPYTAMIALDVDNDKVYFGFNGTWINSANPASGTGGFSILDVASTPTGQYFITCFFASTGMQGSYTLNAGQRPFSYTAPSGFKALCTTNLPEPDIIDGEQYMETYTYTGNGGGLQVGEVAHPYTTYNLDKSLRFNPADAPYLTRTPATGNKRTWTLSWWMKIGSVTGEKGILGVGTSDGSEDVVFLSSQRLRIRYSSGSDNTPAPLLKDVNTWYHVVLSVDTTQATAKDRLRWYVNGQYWDLDSVGYFSDHNSYPSPDFEFRINNNQAHYIGEYPRTSDHFNGYLAEMHFVDGSALTASDFGQYDGNNYWVPKAYTGSYGTNGYYLDFSDTSTTAALGTDSSGNGNDWSTSGFSVTTDSDSVVDVPTSSGTDTGLGGEVKSNYATLNPLVSTTSRLANGNLQTTADGSTFATMYIPSTGKWYYEYTPTVSGNDNIGLSATTVTLADAGLGPVWNSSNGRIYDESGNTGSVISTWGSGNVIGLAVDADAGTLAFYKDGTLATTYTLREAAYKYTPFSRSYSGARGYINFGQKPFTHAAPTGYQCLCTANVPEDITDLETPDLVWIKNRSASASHTLFDVLRGTTKYVSPDDTPGNTTDVNSLLQFNKNGFLLGSSSAVNTSGNNYVAWAWKVNGAGVSNPHGSISSTISANPTAGVSVITWTGTGSSGSLGHGLGKKPFLIISKKTSTTDHFYTKADIPTYGIGSYGYFRLNTPDGVDTGQIFISSADTETFTFTNSVGNDSGATFVGYCFAPVDGFSSMGTYVGNGSSTDGPFVYTGFRPRFLLIKGIDNTIRRWNIVDTARSTYNVSGLRLYADIPNSEDPGGGATFDLLSNGFKLRDSDGNFNASNVTYIYAAFAENPFKYALAR